MPDTMQQVVTDGVAAFEVAEQCCHALYLAIGELAPIVSRANVLQARGAGYLASSAALAQLQVAQGKIAEALAIILDVHIQATAVAVENGVDVPSPNAGGIR